MDMRTFKAVVCGILVVLYLAGMLLLILGNVSAGVSLWSISTIGGLFVLWYLKSTDSRADEAEKDDGESN
ncbi:MAG: hypothetical protein E7317_08980 [Clostridiales bacterium]|nr:hypothetical protein [Clostridiales bacterium]